MLPGISEGMKHFDAPNAADRSVHITTDAVQYSVQYQQMRTESRLIQTRSYFTSTNNRIEKFHLVASIHIIASDSSYHPYLIVESNAAVMRPASPQCHSTLRPHIWAMCIDGKELLFAIYKGIFSQSVYI